jgi:hypothetical protein
MIAKENTYFIATNEVDIFHYGWVEKGQAIDSGQPIIHLFYSKEMFMIKCEEYNIDIDGDEVPDFLPDLTPPALSTLRVAIPDYWWSLFPDDEFILNGYVVQFERVNGILAVDIAYLDWPAFQEELDKPENAAIKRHMMPIWDYVLIEIENHNFI